MEQLEERSDAITINSGGKHLAVSLISCVTLGKLFSYS